jgi:hypothetical protein
MATAEAMLEDLRASIGRDYWKVAIRRFLMMRARAFEVPAAETQRCLAFIARCPPADLLRMERAAGEWARMVSAGT